MSMDVDGEAVVSNDGESPTKFCNKLKETLSVFAKLVLPRCLILSLYCLDISSDVAAAIGDYNAGDKLFAYITIGFVFAPGVLFSFYMCCQNVMKYFGEMACLKAFLWILVGPFLPFWVILKFLRQIIAGLFASLFPSKREAIKERLKRPSRIYLIKFLEAFLEAAPQLLLRLYRVASRSPKPFSDLRTTEIVQISLSIITLSFKVVSTHQNRVSTKQVIAGDTEHDSKYILPWYIQIIATFWWICFLASRFEALALFSASYGKWVILVVGIHVGMIFLFQTIAAVNKGTLKKVFAYLFGAFVFIFAYIQFNLKTRLKIASWFPYTVFSIVVFVENSIMLTFWFYNQRMNAENILYSVNNRNLTSIFDSINGSMRVPLYDINATNFTDCVLPLTNSSNTNNLEAFYGNSLLNNLSTMPNTTITNPLCVIKNNSLDTMSINTTSMLLQREELQHHWEMLLFLHYGLFGASLVFMFLTFCCTTVRNGAYNLPSGEAEEEEEEEKDEGDSGRKSNGVEIEMEVMFKSSESSSLK